MTIFVGGKQKRVKRPPTIDGLSIGEFILRNADPIWLHQNEMWEYITNEDEIPVGSDELGASEEVEDQSSSTGLMDGQNERAQKGEAPPP
jgi:hypothetical protein